MPRIFPVKVNRTTILPPSGAANIIWPDNIKLRDTMQIQTKQQDRIYLSDAVSSNQLILQDRIHLSDTKVATLPSATATKPDTIHLIDKIGLINPVLQDRLHLSDFESLFNPKLPDTLHLTDQVSQISTVQNDTLHTTDALADAKFTNVKYAPSATPNTDFGGDTWVDQANTGVNHGTTNPLNCLKVTVNDEQDGWIKFDMRRYTGLSVKTGGVHTFAGVVGNASLANTPTLTGNFYVFAANPFTESVLTWANRPALPAATATFTFGTVVNNAAQLFTWTFSDAQMTALLGNFVVVVLTQTGVLASLLTVSSRETANRWALTFELKL